MSLSFKGENDVRTVLTVAARISWGQQARRKDLHTFGSLYFVPADSPAKIVKSYHSGENGLISTKFNL